MRKDFKENLLNILNGVSSGVVIALVPGALINELMKGMSSFWPGAQDILTMTTLMQNLLAVFAGGLGQFALPYTKMITGMIGSVVSVLTDFQPLVMGMFMGAIFAALIVSPISSVGIAMAIGIEGIASGSANLGITAGAFTLAIMSSKVNGFGTTIAHFLGTPKIQMANILRNPKLFVPVVVSAGIAGLVGAIFNITGTANSAGFGSAGLIGPLAAYQNMASGPITIVFLVAIFAGMPLLLGYLMRYIFIQKLAFVKEEDLLVKNE